MTAKVTIGMPVYNEADYLSTALDWLATQPFADIEVLIFDNASSDATPEVARSYVAKDPRFHHVRQPENKGELRNFYEAFCAARSPYFMWRACDDRSGDDYIAVLAGLLDEHPHADLAVSRIVTDHLGGKRSREITFPTRIALPPDAASFRMMFASHQSWIYGMFRREALVPRMELVMKQYGNPYGWDHVALFPFLFDRRVVGSNATTFEQVIKARKSAQRYALDWDEVIGYRRKFYAIIRQDVAQRIHSRPRRRMWDFLLWLHTGAKIYKVRKLLRRKLHTRLGMAGQPN